MRVLKYEYYCDSEPSPFKEWREDTDPAPTVCPNGHTISTIKVAGYVDENVVSIKEESVPTGGRFRHRSHKFMACGEQVTIFDYSYPFDINIMTTKTHTSTNMVGDKMTVLVAPDTTIGAITQTVTPSDTTFTVSPTVAPNVFKGLKCRLVSSDMSTASPYTDITAMNTASNTISIDVAFEDTFAPGSYVQIGVCPIDCLEFSAPGIYSIGETKIGGTYVPANTNLRIYYYRMTTGDVDVHFYNEFLY